MMRNPGPQLRTFVDYHTALGFSEFIILFDDPNDRDISLARELPGVVPVVVDETVRKHWQGLRHFDQCKDHVEDTVGARQLLNVEYGYGIALDRGIEWLLHIDIDELFVIKNRDLAAHLSHLEHSDKQCAIYYNYEAVPTSLHFHNFFREVNVFKKPIKLLQHQGIKRQGIWPTGRRYFNFYNNGKSMTKVLPGGYPLGAHRWANDQVPLNKVTFFNPCILHFAVCGFDVFSLKYHHRGNFSDVRIDKDMRKNGALLDLDARDAFHAGDIAGAEEIYRERVMMDSDEVNRLLKAGLLRQFDLSSQLEERSDKS